MNIEIPKKGNWKQKRREIIVQILDHLLSKCSNKNKVARELGMTPRLLFQYLKNNEKLHKYVTGNKKWYNPSKTLQEIEGYEEMKRLYPDG